MPRVLRSAAMKKRPEDYIIVWHERRVKFKGKDKTVHKTHRNGTSKYFGLTACLLAFNVIEEDYVSTSLHYKLSKYTDKDITCLYCIGTVR